MRRPSTLGVIAGALVALAVLGALSVMLMNSDGANYKVLVAVWLWLLPVTGVLAAAGYACGRIVEAIVRARSSDGKGGLRADAG